MAVQEYKSIKSTIMYRLNIKKEGLPIGKQFKNVVAFGKKINANMWRIKTVFGILMIHLKYIQAKFEKVKTNLIF